MKRSLYIVALLLGLLVSVGTGCKDQDAPGQDSVFLKIYGTVGNDVSSAIVQLSDGGFMITGSIYNTGSYDSLDDVVLIRTNENGELVWIKTYGGIGSDRGEDMLLLENDDLLIMGEWGTGPYGKIDLFAMRVDSSGTAKWTKFYGGADNDYGYTACSTATGEYYLVGVTESGNYDASSANPNLLVAKIDGDGNEIWTRSYDSGAEDQARSALSTTDGSIYIGGFSHYVGAGYDATLLKLNDLGDTVWTYRGISDNADFGAAVGELDNGEIALVAFTYTETMAYELFIRVFDSSGVEDTVKASQFGGTDNDRYQCKRFVQPGDGSITGASWSQSYGEGGEDFYLFNMSKEGVDKKLKTFGGSNDDVPTDIIKTRDGGMAIVGHSKSFSADTDKDIILIKTNQNGDLMTADE